MMIAAMTLVPASRAWSLLLAVGVFIGSSWQADQPPGGICDAAAQEAPLDFTLKDINGDAVNLVKYKGHVIVLNFWATWCAPCQFEVPRLVRLQNQYREIGLIVAGLSIDTDPERVPPFARRLGINYPVFTIGEGHSIQKAYAPIWSVPSTVLIRRNGRICRRQMAFVADRDFENRVRGLLRESR